jgi:transposase InsO family protein
VTEDRATTLSLIAEAVASGSRLAVACREVGLDPRTVQRWRKQRDGGADGRKGAHSPPQQKLTEQERQAVVDTANAPEFRNLSPKQIVPRLADQGCYIASESTFYRVLHAANLMTHRGPSKPRTVRRPEELLATGPNQVWSWDISYLPASRRGTFYYLYLFVDVWSRRIMKAVVLGEESAEHAARLLTEACADHEVDPSALTLHSDNGGPMKGATMLATMQWLGVVPSFSRPSVSNDNPYSEALFRTLKYVPSYPRKPFESIDAAWAWVERFVAWYNGEHRHSAIGFVTPDERHESRDVAVLLARRHVYEAARRRNPSRWSRHTRQWDAPAAVSLNLRDREDRAQSAAGLRIGGRPTTSMVPPSASGTAFTPSRHHAATPLLS